MTQQKSPRQSPESSCRGYKYETSFIVLLLLGVEGDLFADFGEHLGGMLRNEEMALRGRCSTMPGHRFSSSS